MVLTIVADRKNSPSSGRPSTSMRTVCVKLPCATPAIARVTSAVGRSKSSTSVLIDTSISPQAPRGARKRVRSLVLPSLPTTWPTRFNSWAICSFAATISLNVSAIFPASPVHAPGSRTEKSPSRMVWRLARIALSSAGAISERPAGCPLLFTLALASSVPTLAPDASDFFMLFSGYKMTFLVQIELALVLESLARISVVRREKGDGRYDI